MEMLFYTLGVLLLTLGLIVASYLDRVYRDLDGSPRAASTNIFRPSNRKSKFGSEWSATAPRSRLPYWRDLWLVVVATVIALGVVFFVPGIWEPLWKLVLLLGLEVVIAMQLLPMLLLAGARGNWVSPLVPIVRLFLWLIWPINVAIDLVASVSSPFRRRTQRSGEGAAGHRSPR